MESRRRPGPSVRVRVTEHTAHGARTREDRLATEEPLEVRVTWPGVADRRVAVTMRTPGHDFELAVGLLHSEGLVSEGMVRAVAYCTEATLSAAERDNVVTVALDRPPLREVGSRSDTVTAAASACGVCGAESIAEVVARAAVRPDRVEAPPVPADVLRALPDRLRAGQRVFDSTGGLHAAGLFDHTGRLLVLREDVGRHNAVDKVVGARLLSGERPSVPLLCVSGRIGFEIVQKAVASGVGALAAIGAPSSLAVELADEAGLGLVGFLSPTRFVVYAGGERLGV